MAIRFDARTNSLSTDASAIDFEQRVTTTASTATVAGLNIAEGIAPSSPIDGDVWVTAGGAFNARLNGATVDLSATGGDVSAAGTPVDNQVGVWTGASTIEGDANLTWSGTALTIAGASAQLIVPSNDTPAAPALAFGDGDTGFYELNDDTLRLSIGTTPLYQFSTTNITGVTSASFYLRNTTVTATNPSLGPRRDTNTGIGSAANDSMSLIAGGAEFMRFDGTVGGQDHIKVEVPLYLDQRTVALNDYANYGQIWVKTATPNELWYTTDDGDDIQITSGTGLAGGSGTVTSVSVVSANGLAGSVATATTTPAITLSTSITGVLKGNGTAISAATAGTDYSAGTNALATGILKSTTTTGALSIALAGDFPTLNQNTTGTAAGLSATLVATSGGTAQSTYATGDVLYASAANTLSKLAAGTNTHVLTLAGGVPTWAAPTVGTVTSSGTPLVNEIAVFTSGTDIDSDSTFTWTGTSFAAYGGGATATHYLGIDASNNLNVEVGSNYATIQLDDDNVSTESQFMYFDLNSASTGAKQFQWMDEGNPQVIWDLDALTYTFAGGIQITEQADHSDAGGVAAGRGQIWVRTGTLGGELMYTEGDADNDYTVANVTELSYKHSQTTTAADPGAGFMRHNNATPASATNLYIDDLESTGRDASFMLANIADGDVLTLRSMWNEANYLVASVNGTPTDNGGYWTVPITVIHAGGRPTTGDPIHITIDWLSQGGGAVAFNDLTAKTSGTGDYTTTGDMTANNFEATDLGPNVTPGTDDLYVGGYGIMGDRAANSVYVTNANASGTVAINAGGVHGSGNNVAVFSTTGMQMDDDMKIFLGTGNDLTLYHNGTDNYIDSVLASSDLYLRTNSNENAIRCRVGNAVELYYNAGKTFATDGPGEVGVYGDVDIDADTRRVNFKQANGTLKGYIGYSASSAIYIRNQTNGSGIIMDATDNAGAVSNILIADPDGDTDIYGEQDVRLYTNAGAHISVQCLDNGATSLHYQGTTALSTRSNTLGHLSTAQVVHPDTNSYDIGLAKMPINEISANEDLDNTNHHKFTNKNAGVAVTLELQNTSNIQTGAMWMIANEDTEDLTIDASTNTCTLRWFDGGGATPSTGNRTIAQAGVATIIKVGVSEYFIWGAGIT